MATALPETPRAGLRVLVIDYLGDPAADGLRTAWSAGRPVARFPVGALDAHFGPREAPLVVNGVFLVEAGAVAGDGALTQVTAVLRRAPITSPEGAVLVSDWPPGAPVYRRRWVSADAP